MNLLASVFSGKEQPGYTPTTGSARSDDGKISYGYALMRGKRASMEDFHEARFRKESINGEKVAFFGVFDADVYVKTDQDYMTSDVGQSRDDGSTAATALLVGRRLLVANVGDSRAVMSRAGKAVPMTVDHKPNRSDERQRIEKAGGHVLWAGTWRVGEPEIHDDVLTPQDEFLLLATDGLWDVISNQEAVNLVRDIQSPEEAAKRLVDEAYRRGSADNITCVVVRFHCD
eukprot:jgi/Chlat1/5251/Chrsp33S08963